MKSAPIIPPDKARKLLQELYRLTEKYNPDSIGTESYLEIRNEFLIACFSYVQPVNSPRSISSVRKGLQSLDKAACKLSKNIETLGLEEYIWIMSEPGCEQLLEKIKGDIDELSAIIRIIRKNSPQYAERKVSKVLRHDFLASIMDIYEKATKRKAGRSYNDGKQKHSGPLVTFAYNCISILTPELRQSVVGETIRSILETRKAGDE